MARDPSVQRLHLQAFEQMCGRNPLLQHHPVGEREILGSQRLSVAPANPLAQEDFVRAAVRRDRYPLREVGDHVEALEAQQASKQIVAEKPALHVVAVARNPILHA